MKLKEMVTLVNENKNLCIVADWTYAGFYRCVASDAPLSLFKYEVVNIDSHECFNELVITLKRQEI